MPSYAATPFPYTPPPELRGAGRRHPIVVVGAGPVGLSCAIDLALHGVPSVLLDDSDVVSHGSRAICWAKRSLEIFDRLGVGSRMVDKGVTWNLGRVFHRDRELYRFDLLPESGHRRPAFINLQQYYVEEYLVDRARDFPDLIDLRWRNKVAGLSPRADAVTLDIETPDGRYALDADWVIAADGARSALRTMMGLALDGTSFEERFLIADVRMEADFPTERLFWFEPVFHAGQSALMHRQPDNVFRLDFQLGPDADPDLERKPERVMSRIRAVVGADTPVELEWCSVYSFRCARLDRFVHGRVVFAGDSAHLVSPFGARGGNGGVQDADNLCWKLARVVKGRSPVSLIDTYDEERRHGADENILHSSRTTDFMSPRTPVARQFRDAVLALAADKPFARALLNAGRLSKPCSLKGFSLQTPDTIAGGLPPGSPCLDAPVLGLDGEQGWLLDHVGGAFTLLVFAADAPNLAAIGAAHPDLRVVVVSPRAQDMPGATTLVDVEGLARSRYTGGPDMGCLIRPDAHVAARFPDLSVSAITDALARAAGQTLLQARNAA